MLRPKPTFDFSQVIEGWVPEPAFADKVTIENLTIFLSGIQSNHKDFGAVTGSAAEVETHPIDRAWFEMVERISIMHSLKSQQSRYPLVSLDGTKLGRELPKDKVFPTAKSADYQYSKSNGVALHRTWEEACKRAAYELIERHLVLSSWLGLTCPTPTTEGAARSPLNSLRQTYDVKRLDMGHQRVTGFANPIYVSTVALLPKQKDAPLIVAFGAGESSKESLRKAEGESIQRLGFLWGEEIPTETPDFAPTNLYHQDYHLQVSQRGILENWLNGSFFKANSGQGKPKTLDISFVDLTSFTQLDLKVARAICPEAIPLVFGRFRDREFADLPEALIIHPIA